jgi:hypothetical protein
MSTHKIVLGGHEYEISIGCMECHTEWKPGFRAVATLKCVSFVTRCSELFIEEVTCICSNEQEAFTKMQMVLRHIYEYGTSPDWKCCIFKLHRYVSNTLAPFIAMG